VELSLPISLLVDGQHVVSDTTAFAAGARVIVLRTAAADADVLLYSTYTGHDRLDKALCSELIEIGEGSPVLVHRIVAVGEGAFTYSRRFALYDHLQHLQLLADLHLGVALRCEGVDQAVRELDPAAV
jgi:hypothetical protein